MDIKQDLVWQAATGIGRPRRKNSATRDARFRKMSDTNVPKYRDIDKTAIFLAAIIVSLKEPAEAI